MANFDIIYKIATDLTGLVAGVNETAKSTDAIDKKITGLQSSVANVGKTLAGVFGAAAIGGAIKGLITDVIELGGQLNDMSAKTGISLKGLQLLKVAAEQNGVSLDQVATAANKLGINIGGGGKDVVSAVTRLGLSLGDLKKGDPESNMFAIAKAMDGIQNPAERAQIAMTLFGKSGLELLPVLNGQFSESAAAAERLGVVIGDDVLKAADTFGDQMTVLRASMMKFTAEALAPMLPGLLKGAELFVGFAAGAITFGRAIVDTVIGALLKAQEIFLGFFTIVADITDHVPLLGKALGATGFSFDSMKAKTQAAADQYKAFGAATERSAAGLDKHSESTKKALPIIGDWGKGVQEASAAAKEHAQALERLTDIERDLGTQAYKQLRQDEKKYWDDIHAAADRFGQQLVKNGFAAMKLADDFRDMNAIVAPGTEGWVRSLENVGIKVGVELPPKITKLGAVIQTNLTKVFEDIPKTLVQALTGGGGIDGAIKAIGTQVGAGIGSSISETLANKASKNIGGALDSFLKSGLGQAVSAALPVIGSLLGPALSGLAKLFGFGKSAAEKALDDVNKLRAAFFEAGGGMKDLEAKASAAGVTLLAVLNARTPEAYTKAIKDLNAAFEFQDQAMKTLDDTVQKYGFTIDQLGPKFAAQKLHEQAGTLIQDYTVLTAAGVDHVAILEKMAPTLNEYVQQSIKAGVAIPKQMEPILQSLADQGLLVDENGEKLTDLSKLTFAETLDEKFNTLIDTIQRLADAIARGVGGALAGAADQAARTRDAIAGIGAAVPGSGYGGGGPDDTSAYGAHGGLVGPNGIRYLDMGGPVGPFIPRGADVVPAMLSVGEGVLSRTGMAALGALNRGDAPGRVVSMEAFLAAQKRTNESLEGLRRDLATSIPTMVGLAARHGVQTRQKGTRR